MAHRRRWTGVPASAPKAWVELCEVDCGVVLHYALIGLNLRMHGTPLPCTLRAVRQSCVNQLLAALRAFEDREHKFGPLVEESGCTCLGLHCRLPRLDSFAWVQPGGERVGAADGSDVDKVTDAILGLQRTLYTETDEFGSLASTLRWVLVHVCILLPCSSLCMPPYFHPPPSASPAPTPLPFPRPEQSACTGAGCSRGILLSATRHWRSVGSQRLESQCTAARHARSEHTFQLKEAATELGCAAVRRCVSSFGGSGGVQVFCGK